MRSLQENWRSHLYIAVIYRTSTSLLFPWGCTVVHCYSNGSKSAVIQRIAHVIIIINMVSLGPKWYQVEIAFLAVTYKLALVLFFSCGCTSILLF